MSKPIVDWFLSCGRICLTVNGYVVAMEGDVLRSAALTDKNRELGVIKWGEDFGTYERWYTDCWSSELIKYVAESAQFEEKTLFQKIKDSFK